MSVQAMSWVIDHSKQRGSKFVVLLMIANHSHSDGTGSYAGYERLARESRLKPRRVMDIVESLRKSGELEIEKGAGPHGTNLYSLPLMRADSTYVMGVQKPAHAIQKPNGGANLVSKLHPNRKEPNESNEESGNEDLNCIDSIDSRKDEFFEELPF